MKNKKIYLTLIAIALFAIMIIANTTYVQASDSVEEPDEFEIRTKIERWTPVNDLKFVKNDDWYGNWYTKTVYLRGTMRNTSNEVDVQITESMLDGNELELGIESFNDQYPFDFEYGSDVYLVEKFEINNQINYSVGGTETSNLPTTDRLELDISNSEIVNTSMTNYDPEDSYTLYTYARYQSSTPSETQRDAYIWCNLEDSESSEKTTYKEQGTINLPVFYIQADYFSASGNVMPAGNFEISDISIMDSMNNETYNMSSSYGYLSGYIYYQDDYSLFSYKTLENMSTPSVYYNWSNESIATSSGSYSVDTNFSSVTTDYTSENAYKRVLSGSLYKNESAPNGVFYDILPFAIAGIVAIAGIIILKKNSVK